MKRIALCVTALLMLSCSARNEYQALKPVSGIRLTKAVRWPFGTG